MGGWNLRSEAGLAGPGDPSWEAGKDVLAAKTANIEEKRVLAGFLDFL